jgi:hypothetical protein
MEITDRQLKSLFTIANMIPMSIPKGVAGQNVSLKINGADVSATYLVDLDAGEAIALLTNKGNWYLVGEPTLNIVQSTRRIIEYRKTDSIRTKISNLYYLYSLNNKVYASNNITTDLITLPDNFGSNYVRSYIHNDGGKYRLAFSNNIDNAGTIILNYANKFSYHQKNIDGILTSIQNNIDGITIYNSIDYKGSCIWKSNNLSPVVNRISSSGEFNNVLYNGVYPFDSLASGSIIRTGNDVSGYNYTGNFNSPTYFYTLDYDIDQFKTGSVSYLFNSFDYGFHDSRSTQNNTVNSINTSNIDTDNFDYSFTLTTTENNDIVLENYTYTSIFPIICFKKGIIYSSENNSSISKKRQHPNNSNIDFGRIISISRNIEYYYKDSNDNIITLNNSSILRLESNTSFNVSSGITIFISNLINPTYSNYNLLTSLPNESEFVNKQILIGKKNSNGYVLYRGVLNSIVYTKDIGDEVVLSITCNITINSVETKPFISFASVNGTLIMNEGSIYTYLHLEEINEQGFSYGNLAINNNTLFSYTTPVEIPYLTENNVSRPTLVPTTNLINTRIQKDNLNKNNIYITNIPDFNKGGNLVAYIEVWNIGSDGKILYQKTLTQKLSRIPKNATLYAASYYK